MGLSSRTIYLNTFLLLLVTLTIVQLWEEEMLYRCVTISCVCGNYLWQGYVFMATLITVYALDILHQMPSTLLRPPYFSQQPVIIIILYITILLFNLVGFLPTKRGYEVSKGAHNFGAAWAIVVPTGILMQWFFAPKLRFNQENYFKRGRLPSRFHAILAIPTLCGTFIYPCSPWRQPDGPEYSDHGCPIAVPLDRDQEAQQVPEARVPESVARPSALSSFIAKCMLWNPFLQPLDGSFRSSAGLGRRIVASITLFVAFFLLSGISWNHPARVDSEEEVILSNSLRWVNIVGIYVELAGLLLVRSNVEFLVRKLRLPRERIDRLKRASVLLSSDAVEEQEKQRAEIRRLVLLDLVNKRDEH